MFAPWSRCCSLHIDRERGGRSGDWINCGESGRKSAALVSEAGSVFPPAVAKSIGNSVANRNVFRSYPVMAFTGPNSYGSVSFMKKTRPRETSGATRLTGFP